MLDLAASGAAPDRVAAALDSAIRKRLSAPQVFIDRLPELRGRRGARLLDQLLLDASGESVLERRFLKLVREDRLPRPETQRRIRCDGRHVARVDFVYAAKRIVTEVTGRLGHSNPADRARHAQRRNELQDLGYRVYEYTRAKRVSDWVAPYNPPWGDLNRRPAYVVESLQRRLAA